LLMKSDPEGHTASESSRCFDAGFEYARHDIADRLRRRWQHLEKRIRKMEDKITSREFGWNDRFYR
jgi:phage shock protein C